MSVRERDAQQCPSGSSRREARRHWVNAAQAVQEGSVDCVTLTIPARRPRLGLPALVAERRADRAVALERTHTLHTVADQRLVVPACD